MLDGRGSAGRRLSAGVLALTSGLATCACEPPSVDADPAAVVEAFVTRMRRVHGDPKSAGAAYELLDQETQNNLAERAKRASALAGRKLGPEEMLVPSRFELNFEPKRYAAELQGSWALVRVYGAEPTKQRAELRCRLDGAVWRLALPLPALPPIEVRAGSERGEPR